MESNVHTENLVLASGAVIGQLTRPQAEYQVTNFLTPIVFLLLLAHGHTVFFETCIVHVLSVPVGESYLGEQLWTSTARAIRATYDTMDGCILHDFMIVNKHRLLDQGYRDLMQNLSAEHAKIMEMFVFCDMKPSYYADMENTLETCVGMQNPDAFLESALRLFVARMILQVAEIYESFVHVDDWPDDHPWMQLNPRLVFQSWMDGWGFEVSDSTRRTLALADQLFPEAYAAPMRRIHRLATGGCVPIVHSLIMGAPPDDHFTKEDMQMVPREKDKSP